MYKYIFISLTVLLSGCATTNYDNLATSCEKQDYASCYQAANYYMHLRASNLEPCKGKGSFCIKPGESRKEAYDRLGKEAIKQNGLACNSGNNTQACLDAGTSLAIKSSEMPIDSYKKTADKAEMFFKKACAPGSEQGCKFRGSTYRAGT